MRTLDLFRLAVIIAGLTAAPSVTLAAPACKGPNKNDAGCNTDSGDSEPPVEAASSSVDSAVVDWLNEKVTLRGSALDTVVDFTLGGSTTLSISPISPSEVDIPFDSLVAGEVTIAGNYALKADGTDIVSIYFKSQVVDAAAVGCPCDGDWSTELSGLWGTPEAECLEIAGPGSNDIADIAGTVLTDPNDPSVYPQFPIGASFYPGDPVNSSCRLVQVNGDATTSELVKFRINEAQQADCAASLKVNVCATTIPGP